jgi:hypothetical protein
MRIKQVDEGELNFPSTTSIDSGFATIVHACQHKFRDITLIISFVIVIIIVIVTSSVNLKSARSVLSQSKLCEKATSFH